MQRSPRRPQRLGVLPAAGQADRWGGYPKELLPISNDHTFLSRSVGLLQSSGCDQVLVVTNPTKIHLHAYHLRDWQGVQFAIQQGDEMWGAMKTAITVPADEYLFMMPDTYVSDPPFPPLERGAFGLGVFLTEEPERFGVIRDGHVVNKAPSDKPGLAWGVLAWNHAVANRWRERQLHSYTQAINDAIDEFGYVTWKLDYYFDVGSMSHYTEFLLSNPEIAHLVELDAAEIDAVVQVRE